VNPVPALFAAGPFDAGRLGCGEGEERDPKGHDDVVHVCANYRQRFTFTFIFRSCYGNSVANSVEPPTSDCLSVNIMGKKKEKSPSTILPRAIVRHRFK
jgi:hypothetical protein